MCSVKIQGFSMNPTFILAQENRAPQLDIVFSMVITAAGLEPPSLTAIYLVQSNYIYIYIYVYTYMYVSLTLTSSLAWPFFITHNGRE